MVDSHREPDDTAASTVYNRVTFIYQPTEPLPVEMSVIGDFVELYQPLPLLRVGDTYYYALTLWILRGEVHSYRILVDGQLRLDRLNPQRMTLDHGKTWSRFFTQDCTVPLVLERSERQLLERLCAHILPFRTKAAENFLIRRSQCDLSGLSVGLTEQSAYNIGGMSKSLGG